jgi:hypothetical protein
MTAKVRIRAALACEDIRTEITGKSIYIGVLGPSLMVPIFPALQTIAFMIIADFMEMGNFFIELQVLDEKDNRAMHASLEGEISKIENGVPINLGQTGMKLGEPTILRLQARTEPDGVWETVQSWSIEQMPTVQLQPQETAQS